MYGRAVGLSPRRTVSALHPPTPIAAAAKSRQRHTRRQGRPERNILIMIPTHPNACAVNHHSGKHMIKRADRLRPKNASQFLSGPGEERHEAHADQLGGLESVASPCQ